MPDEIPHDLLVSKENLAQAQEITQWAIGIGADYDPTATITAFAVALMVTCQQADCDPLQVLEQVIDTAELGSAIAKGLN